MKPTHIQALIAALGTDPDGLSRLIGASPDVVEEWLMGGRTPDAAAVFQLRRLCSSALIWRHTNGRTAASRGNVALEASFGTRRGEERPA